jgi:hypothetical protein
MKFVTKIHICVKIEIHIMEEGKVNFSVHAIKAYGAMEV